MTKQRSPGETISFLGLDREMEELRRPLLGAIERVLAEGKFLQGDEIERLESQLANQAGRRHAIAVNSGTDALYFALSAAGVGAGDEVLVPNFSFVATASSVLRTGAKPIFVDVDDALGLNLEIADSAVSHTTKAIVYVHLFGRMSQSTAVEAFARKHTLAMIEDAAQAFGAELGSRVAGSLGDLSCYSFDPTKIVGAPGNGGMVLTDNDRFAETIRALRYHGKAPNGEFVHLGYNSQLSTIAAACLLIKLGPSVRWLERRREIAEFYRNGLAELPIELPLRGEKNQHTFHKFVIRIRERDALRTTLRTHGIPTPIHYPYLLNELPFVRSRPHRVIDSGRAAAATREVLSLPIHPYLTNKEIERVVDAIRSFVLAGTAADRAGVGG